MCPPLQIGRSEHDVSENNEVINHIVVTTTVDSGTADGIF